MSKVHHKALEYALILTEPFNQEADILIFTHTFRDLTHFLPAGDTWVPGKVDCLSRLEWFANFIIFTPDKGINTFLIKYTS